MNIEELFEMLLVVNLENQLVFITDFSTGYTMVSSNASRYGINETKTENFGLLWKERVHPNDLVMFEKDMSEVFSGKRVRHHLRYQVKTEDERYEEIICIGNVLTVENRKYFVGAM